MIANGQRTAAQLEPLRSAPGQRLRPAAAAAWDRLAYAVRARFGWLPRLTDSYRPRAVQEALFRKRYRPGAGFDTRLWNGEPWHRVTGPAAAVPGTSNHGWGLAVDCTDLAESGFYGLRYKQFMSLAPEYGWTNNEGIRVSESWHLVYNPGLDQHEGEEPTGAWDMQKIDLRGADKQPAMFPEVRKLNALLLAHGYGPAGLQRGGVPHNRASSATRRALGAFQVKTGTGSAGKADYICGEATWAALIEG
jgi:hypothetical protein